MGAVLATDPAGSQPRTGLSWPSWQSKSSDVIISFYKSHIPNTVDAPKSYMLETKSSMAVRESTVRISRILVADDDPLVRKLFAKKLRSAGYSVSEAKSGPEALSLLRRMHFRLLVLDLDMPDDGTDGFEILKFVRTELPHLQVLVISGYLRGALLEAAECLGARLSLYKDSAPRLLLESTRRLLGE